MNLDLGRRKAAPKTGDEPLVLEGSQIGYTVADFWTWSVSDLLSNATRGRFAEFIVGTAISIDPNNLREEWDAYDLVSSTGTKVEVKSAAYLQSWGQQRYSSISFSIKAGRAWEGEGDQQRRGTARRHAGVYVFCLLKHKDQATVDPLKMEQWEFYVVSTHVLNEERPSQSTISLNSLRKIAEPTDYSQVGKRIELANGKIKYTDNTGYTPTPANRQARGA